MSKYIGEGTAKFYDTLTKVGNVSYDINKSYTQYAGFLEGLMYGMFHELSDEHKKYYTERVSEKLRELEAERFYADVK